MIPIVAVIQNAATSCILRHFSLSPLQHLLQMIYLLWRGFWSATISQLPLLKQVYCSGFMSRHYRMPQKNPTYSGDHKKRRNKSHVQRRAKNALQQAHPNSSFFLQWMSVVVRCELVKTYQLNYCKKNVIKLFIEVTLLLW